MSHLMRALQDTNFDTGLKERECRAREVNHAGNVPLVSIFCGLYAYIRLQSGATPGATMAGREEEKDTKNALP